MAVDPKLAERASRLFELACDLEPNAQRVLLERECAGSVELRDLVDELLEGDRAPLESLERPAIALTDLSLPEAEEEEPPPERIHGFRILRRIGHGGMGTVYEAEQDRPRRRVAIKVIRAALVTERLHQRFADEAQVLGTLDHPGIAHVHEAGHFDGPRGPRPFIVMQYVDGVPCTEHVRERNLPLSQRTALLIRVCEAVQHAHQKGVLHRDLKPANVLVDQAGNPRVLDFGIARTLAPADDGTSVETGVSGTVAYMAPEQISADPVPADTRSDVYALGVLGYELLGGAHPFPNASAPDSASTRTPPPALEARPATLAREIEAVLHKALAADRDQRYASASELATDLRHCLERRPTSARLHGPWGRLVLFARRSPALATTVLVIPVLLLAGLTGTLSQANKAEQEKVRARELAALSSMSNARLAAGRGQWDRALESYAQARALGSIDPVEILLGEVEAWDGKIDHDQVREILGSLTDRPDLGAHRARVLLWQGLFQLRSDPDVASGAALLRDALAEAETQTGSLSESEELLAQAFLADELKVQRQLLVASVETDPNHRRARLALVPVQLMLGELEEGLAGANALIAVYPEDPTGYFLKGLALALLGGREPELVAVQARVAEHGHPRAAVVLEMLVELAQLVRNFDAEAVAWLVRAEDPASRRDSTQLLRVLGLAAKSWGMMQQNADASDRPFTSTLTSPAMQRVVTDVVQYFLTVPLAAMVPGVPPRSPADDVAAMRRSVRAYPVGILHFMLGMFQRADGQLLEAELSMRHAVATPSPVPIPRAPLYYALDTQVQLYQRKSGSASHAPGARTRGLRNLDRLLAFEHHDRDELRYLCDAAVALHAREIATAVAERWWRTLGDVDGLAQLAWLRFRDGADAIARDLASQALEQAPQHALALRVLEALGEDP